MFRSASCGSAAVHPTKSRLRARFPEIGDVGEAAPPSGAARAGYSRQRGEVHLVTLGRMHAVYSTTQFPEWAESRGTATAAGRKAAQRRFDIPLTLFLLRHLEDVALL